MHCVPPQAQVRSVPLMLAVQSHVFELCSAGPQPTIAAHARPTEIPSATIPQCFRFVSVELSKARPRCSKKRDSSAVMQVPFRLSHEFEYDPRVTPEDRLSRIVLGHAPPEAASALKGRAGLDETLRSLIDAAEAEHGLRVEPEVFLPFLAERVPADGAFEQLAVSDLYLACACLHGVPRAADRLVQTLSPALERGLSRARAEPALAAEARQLTFAQLLAPDRGRSKLWDYAGRGPLAAWLLVVGIRNVLQLERERRGLREDVIDSVMELPLEVAEPAGVLAPDCERLKAALQAAASSLTPRERTVLKLNFAEGLNIEEIGQLYSVHRATVARWIASAREALLKRTRAQFQTAGTHGDALESLLRLADSRLDLSLSTLLHVQLRRRRREGLSARRRVRCRQSFDARRPARSASARRTSVGGPSASSTRAASAASRSMRARSSGRSERAPRRDRAERPPEARPAGSGASRARGGPARARGPRGGLADLGVPARERGAQHQSLERLQLPELLEARPRLLQDRPGLPSHPEIEIALALVPPAVRQRDALRSDALVHSAGALEQGHRLRCVAAHGPVPGLVDRHDRELRMNRTMNPLEDSAARANAGATSEGSCPSCAWPTATRFCAPPTSRWLVPKRGSRMFRARSACASIPPRSSRGEARPRSAASGGRRRRGAWRRDALEPGEDTSASGHAPRRGALRGRGAHRQVRPDLRGRERVRAVLLLGELQPVPASASPSAVRPSPIAEEAWSRNRCRRTGSDSGMRSSRAVARPSESYAAFVSAATRCAPASESSASARRSSGPRAVRGFDRLEVTLAGLLHLAGVLVRVREQLERFGALDGALQHRVLPVRLVERARLLEERRGATRPAKGVQLRDVLAVGSPRRTRRRALATRRHPRRRILQGLRASIELTACGAFETTASSAERKRFASASASSRRRSRHASWRLRSASD